MSTTKRDLLIHYDEESQKLILYSVDANSTATIRLEGFDGVCPEIQFFKSMPAEEAELKLGGLVFSLIDLGSLKKIGIREYAAEAAEGYKQYVAELERQVGQNDPQAQYSLFIHMHSVAMKTLSTTALARAEELLKSAAAQGYEDAQSSLDSWPLLKAAAERRIARGEA